MYAGRVVEDGPVTEVFRNPRHPYTVGLLKSMPTLGDATRMKAAGEKLAAIPGVVAEPARHAPRLLLRSALPLGRRRLPRRCPGAGGGGRAAPQPLHPLGGGRP